MFYKFWIQIIQYLVKSRNKSLCHEWSSEISDLFQSVYPRFQQGFQVSNQFKKYQRVVPGMKTLSREFAGLWLGWWVGVPMPCCPLAYIGVQVQWLFLASHSCITSICITSFCTIIIIDSLCYNHTHRAQVVGSYECPSAHIPCIYVYIIILYYNYDNINIYDIYMGCVHLGTYRSQLLRPCGLLTYLLPNWS